MNYGLLGRKYAPNQEDEKHQIRGLLTAQAVAPTQQRYKHNVNRNSNYPSIAYYPDR